MRNVVLLCIPIFLFLIIGCSSLITPTLVSPFSSYSANIDTSVGCENFSQNTDDIQLIKGNTLSVVANKKGTPGLYMNAIASKQFSFTDNVDYFISGEWRRPSNAQNEQVEINLQLVQNFVEYHAEIIFRTNPNNPNYQGVYTRGQDLNNLIKLFDFKDDTEWKSFFMIVSYRDGQRIIRRISVDGDSTDINLMMGTVKKDYETAFGILLETTNYYTNCSNINTFVGRSEWRNISITTQ